jgi:hypothetical protein
VSKRPHGQGSTGTIAIHILLELHPRRGVPLSCGPCAATTSYFNALLMQTAWCSSEGAMHNAALLDSCRSLPKACFECCMSFVGASAALHCTSCAALIISPFVSLSARSMTPRHLPCHARHCMDHARARSSQQCAPKKSCVETTRSRALVDKGGCGLAADACSGDTRRPAACIL